MLRALTIPLVAVTLAGCAGPTEPAGSLSGVWKLDAAGGAPAPSEMTLIELGSAVTGTGSAMGVDVPMPISIQGTYTPASGVARLNLTYLNGGGITADYTASLEPSGLLAGTAVFHGITTNGPVSVSMSFFRGTGLEGTATRGPIMPVCRVGVPCDAPFSAWFTVQQQSRLVARFHSDSAGGYEVLLAPGQYTIVPDSTAPVFPRGQSRPATVGPVGLTHLDLQFDTGIR